MREIKLTVRGDTVHASRHRAGIQGECNATALVVSFDESWDGYAKKITFFDALEQNPVVLWLDNFAMDNDTRTYQTAIPGEPLTEAGECTLVIDGVADNARARSMSVRLTVEAAPQNDNAEEPADPKLDQYEQVMVQIVTAVGNSERAVKRAEDGAMRAEQAAANAEEYTSNPPKIGDNGNWWRWDGEVRDYVDTGKSSRGVQGQQGVQGIQGLQGERGPSGVYVGSGDMPEDCNVQIDPEDEALAIEDLIGPQGPQGERGPQGETGPQGEQGPQGIPGELTVRQGNTLYANALKGTASGPMVSMDDVSPLEHIVPVKVRSKNLVDADKMLNNNLTKDENGVYRITQKSAKAYMFDTPIPANTPIVLTYENFDGYNANSDALFSHSVYFADGTVASGNWVGVSANFGNSLRINASKPITGFLLVTYNPSDDFYATFTGVQMEIGITATAHTPYVPDLTAVTLTKTGLNLWDEQWELGTIYNSGNAAGATDTICSKNFIPVKAGVKLRFTLPQMARVIYYDTNKTAYNSAYPSSGSTLTPSQDGYIRFAIGASVGTGNPAITEYGNNICISVFDEATQGVYEPYKGENYVPSEDGTCEVVSVAPIMTLLTDTPGVVIDCEYNRDINKAFEQLTQAIISMGGNI